MLNSVKYLFLASILFLFSCKNDNASKIQDKELITLQGEFDKSPNDSNYEKLITKYLQLIQANRTDKSLVESLLLNASNASEKLGKDSQQLVFLNNLIKDFPQRADTKENILKMINLLSKLGKKQASEVMALSFAKGFSNETKAQEFKASITSAASPEDYILNIGKAIFADTAKGFSEQDALAYVDACEAFALVLPKDPEAPEFINKAAEISNALKTYDKSFSLYDWLNNSYSDNKRGQMALFMKAFLFDESLKDVENARKYYQEFIDKYPNHEFAKQAKLLMENLGKSQEEVLKSLQGKNKDK